MKTFEKNLLKKLKKSSNIFIMGHKSLDLDALGAAAGISAIAKKYNKEAKIIINDKEHESAVKLALEYLKDKIVVTNSKKRFLSFLHKNKDSCYRVLIIF